MMAGFNRWALLAAKIKPACQKGVKATAHAMVANIQGPAPRRTGFMADNVYMSAWDESTYGQGPAPPTDDVYLLPEEKPGDDMSAIVGAAADYSAFVNYGTRYMAAQPFFDQGVETTQGEFEGITRVAFNEGLA